MTTAASARPSRPAHLDPTLIGVVALGGVVGTALRYLLSTAWPTGGYFPAATLIENVVGAFALGLLLESLLRRGARPARAQLLRLLLGTGLLGGFTTFSAIGLEMHTLMSDGAVGTALGYGLGSVILGLIACYAGVALAARRGSAGRGSAGHASTRLGPAGQDSTRQGSTGQDSTRQGSTGQRRPGQAPDMDANS